MARTEKCPYCGGAREEKTDRMPKSGIEYRCWHCQNCGDRVVDMEQLNELADKERAMRRYHVKLSKWGESIAIRIPKVLLKKYMLKSGSEVSLIPEEGAIKIVA